MNLANVIFWFVILITITVVGYVTRSLQMELGMIKDLLTSAFALLTALVALAAFAPKLLKGYGELLGTVAGTTFDQAKFKLKFKNPAENLELALRFMAWFYRLVGISVVILIFNFLFYSVPCIGLTCYIDSLPLPFIAGSVIGLCGLYLLMVGAAMLDLFYEVACEILKKGN